MNLHNQMVEPDKKITGYILIIIVIISFILSQAQVVFAQENNIPFTIVNLQNQVLVDPGESITVPITIYNSSNSPIQGTLSIIDFTTGNADGSPVFIDTALETSSEFSAKDWMKLPVSNIEIAPQNKTSVNVNIFIPFNAEAQSRHAAVVFTVKDSTLQTEEIDEVETPIEILPQQASLFFIRVLGETDESASFTNYQTPSVMDTGPIPVSFEIENKGNIPIEPKGIVTVTDMFGRMISEEKINTVTILPNTTTSYKTTIGQQIMIGKYTVKAVALYGNSGNMLEIGSVVWVIPFKLITLIVLTCIIVVVFLNTIKNNTIIYNRELEKQVKEDEKELQKLRDQLRNS